VSPRAIIEHILVEAPVLEEGTRLDDAVRTLLDAKLPALPVVDAGERYRGIFGEREFVSAVFPGYVKTLNYAGFVPRPIEDVLEKRREAAVEPVRDHMNTERIDVPVDASDIQLAETFLHHRVLIVPVTDRGRVVGVLTRSAFFRGLAERYLALDS
jgi:CBS domain-containing protein